MRKQKFKSEERKILERGRMWGGSESQELALMDHSGEERRFLLLWGISGDPPIFDLRGDIFFFDFYTSILDVGEFNVSFGRKRVEEAAAAGAIANVKNPSFHCNCKSLLSPHFCSWLALAMATILLFWPMTGSPPEAIFSSCLLFILWPKERREGGGEFRGCPLNLFSSLIAVICNIAVFIFFLCHHLELDVFSMDGGPPPNNNQMHHRLHVARYYLNSHFHYDDDVLTDRRIKAGLMECLDIMVPTVEERCDILVQLDSYENEVGEFGRSLAIETRKQKHPGTFFLIWNTFGNDTKELKNFAMRILNLTCSASTCERNWSSFSLEARKGYCKQQSKSEWFIPLPLRESTKIALH
ncbi:hypothetical protein EJ110_NYTH47890 [Nymphaea thermarum]|nr:hypothetical protein EJ110_NYTH47890 [Nymphaea thermarum]